MKKFIKFVPIILTTTLFVGCINDSTSTSTVAPFTTSECNSFKGANNLTDTFLDSTINARCSTTITETPCEFIVNNYVNSTDSSIETECPNGKIVKVSRNITVVVDGGSSSELNSSSDLTSSSSADALSSGEIASSNSNPSSTVSSSTITQSSSTVSSIDVMKLSAIERSVRYSQNGIPIAISAINATRDTINFNIPYNYYLMQDSISGNIQYKFDAPVDISSYTKLTFKAHGTDTVNVCLMEADYGVWKGFWSVDEYGDSTEIGAITGGICFRAKLNATEKVYTFDLTKTITVANNLSNSVFWGGMLYRNGGFSEETIQLYWDYIKHNTYAIEVRAGFDTQLTNQVITDIQLQ